MCELFPPFCHRFPTFLQHIAGIPFPDAKHRFIPAVYALPSPRAAVCRQTRISYLYWVLVCRHTAAFAIPCHRSKIPLRIKVLFLKVKFFRFRQKISAEKKNKKKKVKVYRRENALTISSPKGFFAKNIAVQNTTSIFFAKKYCIAFSLQKGIALSFFSFFLLKNFRSNVGF